MLFDQDHFLAASTFFSYLDKKDCKSGGVNLAYLPFYFPISSSRTKQ